MTGKPISDAWYARASKLIPLATQTSSKATRRFAEGFGPKFLDHGYGVYVMDVDGSHYIDWTMALGAVTVGYANNRIYKAASKGMSQGNLLTLPTACEVELAELLHRIVPGLEMVRFLKTGSDATTAAVRLARAYTGRQMVVRCGYHGWHDWALNADYQEKLGIPQCVRDMTVSVPFNDIQVVKERLSGGQIAALIIEPVSLLKPDDGYLAKLRELCDEFGTVLVFDEVITGIRLAPGGAQEHFGVTADLVCMGKGLANGHSLSAVGGKAAIMEMFLETHISGTYYGEMSSIYAAIETITMLIDQKFWPHAATIGQVLIDSYRAVVISCGMENFTRILGLPHFTSIQWDDPAHFTLFQQEMMRLGILFSGSQFPALEHRNGEVFQTVNAYEVAMEIVSDAIRSGTVEKMLECQVNRPIFRRQ